MESSTGAAPSSARRDVEAKSDHGRVAGKASPSGNENSAIGGITNAVSVIPCRHCVNAGYLGIWFGGDKSLITPRHIELIKCARQAV